jgi:hypothetical protein
MFVNFVVKLDKNVWEELTSYYLSNALCVRCRGQYTNSIDPNYVKSPRHNLNISQHSILSDN